MEIDQWEPNPNRFSRAACRQYGAKSLENTNGYSLRNFTCLDGKLLRENCKAPLSKESCFQFGADDAVLRAQGKENKAK